MWQLIVGPVFMCFPEGGDRTITYMKSLHFTKSFIFACLILGGLLLPLHSVNASQEDRAQVSVVVRDAESRVAVAHASGALLNPVTGQVVRAAESGENGRLLFPNMLPGQYTLRVTFVGYDTYLQENINVARNDLHLGEIYLKAAGETLDEVLVQAETPSMQLGIDRRIFNVSESMVSVGGTASDLLENVPSLQVDVDGNVSLRGSTSVKILIDGKESAMAGSDINQLLQSMPANSIERIEVVTNPSSRYDAEGQSGIINIVLKKNLRLGLNGSITASAGSYDNYSAGATLNFRDNKFNYFGSYNFNRRNRIGDGMNTTRLLSTNSLTHNTSESARLGLNNSIKLGVDHYLSEKTTLSLTGDLSLRGNNRKEDIFYTYTGHPSLSGTSERNSRQEEDDLGFDLNFDFRHEFARQREELTANIGYGRDTEDGLNRFDQVFSAAEAGSELRLNDTGEKGTNFNVQVDYVRPLGEEGKLEAGYRSHVRGSNDRQYSEWSTDGGALIPDFDVSNEFEMTNQVHALYGNYQQKFTEKFGVQIGLRAEQAILNTAYVNLDPAVTDPRTEGQLDYFRIYPSLFLTQEFRGGNQLQASYTRRVNRPRGWQVNPFIDLSDPLNIREGNPDLLPEDIHSFELSYARIWQGVTLTSSGYYRLMNDVVQPIITVVDGSDGATISQWHNISRNETTGFEFISMINLHERVDLTANLNAFHTRFHGSEQYDIAPSEGFSWNANLTTNAKFTPTFSGQVRFDYRAPRIWAQGKGRESYVIDAGLRWDVMPRRASINFNVRDLLDQRRWGGYTETPNVYREFESRWMRRSFTLSFNYRFGSQDNQRDDRRRRNQDDFDMGGGAGEEVF